MTNYSKTIRNGLRSNWIDWCIQFAFWHTVRAECCTPRIKKHREYFKEREYARVGKWTNRALKHKPDVYQLSQIEQIHRSYTEVFFGEAQ